MQILGQSKQSDTAAKAVVEKVFEVKPFDSLLDIQSELLKPLVNTAQNDKATHKKGYC
jgi:hypothetical protein